MRAGVTVEFFTLSGQRLFDRHAIATSLNAHDVCGSSAKAHIPTEVHAGHKQTDGASVVREH